jgi:hypothetical protein
MVVNTWVVVIIQGDGERTPVARRSTRRAAYREIDELRSVLPVISPNKHPNIVVSAGCARTYNGDRITVHRKDFFKGADRVESVVIASGPLGKLGTLRGRLFTAAKPRPARHQA